MIPERRDLVIVGSGPAGQKAAIQGAKAGRRALVIGAGSMGGLAAAQLRKAGVAEIVLASRSLANAQQLAARCAAGGTPARAVALDAVTAALATADLVVCCTGALDPVLGVDQLVAARGHGPAPLVVCDLGLPRDVEVGVGELPGVTLLGLASLQHRLEHCGAASPATGAAEHAHRLVADEVRGYLLAQRTAEVTPTVTALRKRATEVVDAELLRLDGRLPGLDTGVRDELARTVRRVVDKLLHTPTVRIKQLAESGGGEAYADALRELFGLDPQTVVALAATMHTADPSTAAGAAHWSATAGGTR